MIKKTLYFGNPAYLCLRNGQMLLRLSEVENSKTMTDRFKQQAERSFPIEDLGVVVLDHQQIFNFLSMYDIVQAERMLMCISSELNLLFLLWGK